MYSSSYDSKKSDSTEEVNSEPNTKFKFPPAPRLCRTTSNSPRTISRCSNSSVSDSKLIRTKRRNRRKSARSLPPIGVFWDIENCQVPKTKSATSVVQRIRELFYKEYREAEFIVVCDVKKESSQIISDLNDAQVNLIHVSSTSKNAADEKLRQSLRRFAELHEAPAAVALISGDVNFAADLSDLRYRKKIQVILLHNSNVADALILCANETHNFSKLIESIPCVLKFKTANNAQADLHVYNLPVTLNDFAKLKCVKIRLKLLTDNCGGRVMHVNKENGTAIIRFSSFDIAKRAQKRLEGEDVFGYTIHVSEPFLLKESPIKNSGLATRGVPFNIHNSSADDSTRNSWYIEGEQNTSPTFRPIKGTGFMNTLHNRQSNFKNNTVNYFYEDVLNTSKSFQSPVKNMSFADNYLPVDLVISNLDAKMHMKQLRILLLNMLKTFVMVLYFQINKISDGILIANVRVKNLKEAQFVLSQLNRRWVGTKQLVVSYSNSNLDIPHIRMIVKSILQESPDKKMSLANFFTTMDQRFNYKVSLTDLAQINDICPITDVENALFISLLPSAINANLLYCAEHAIGRLEEPKDFILPKISIPFGLFQNQVNKLLTTHSNYLPLLSFSMCYEAEFGQPLFEDEAGVPIEHLIACISNVEIARHSQVKNIKFIRNKDPAVEEDDLAIKSVPTAYIPNIMTFYREVIALLSTINGCQLLINNFIPAYHRFFGRQCRLVDYGFSRLIDLFETIPNVVQIMGFGAKRTITLTHTIQMKRFIVDFFKVINSQSSNRILSTEFAYLYDKVHERSFNPIDYGLCSFEDILFEVPQETISITKKGNILVVSQIKKKQSDKEIKHIKKFAKELEELLEHTPHCSIGFNKFISFYQRYFSKPLKLSDYGVTKLPDLFKAIPETVLVEGSTDENRFIKLTQFLALQVIGKHLQQLIKKEALQVIHTAKLSDIYEREYGFPLEPQFYACNNLEDLLSKIQDYVSIVPSNNGILLSLPNYMFKNLDDVRVWGLLLNPPHSASIVTIIHDYKIRYSNTLSIFKLEELTDVIELRNAGMQTVVFLTAKYELAARLYHLLYANGGQMLLKTITTIYRHKFDAEIVPEDFNAGSLKELLRSFDCLFVLMDCEHDTNVLLNNSLEHIIKDANRTESCGGQDHILTAFSETKELKLSSSSQNNLYFQFGPVIPKIQTPDPVILPLPDKLIIKGREPTHVSSDSDLYKGRRLDDSLRSKEL